MQKLLIDSLMYVFEGVLFYYYSSSLFETDKTKKIKVLSVAIISLILFLIYQVGLGWLNAIMLILLYTLVLSLIFNATLKTAIVHSVIFILFMTASEIFVMSMSTFLFDNFNAMQTDINAYVFVVVASKLIYSSIIVAIKKLIVSKKGEKVHDKLFWILFILPLSNLLLIILFRYMAYSSINAQISFFASLVSIITLFANIIVFAIYEYGLKNNNELYELRAMKYQQEIDDKYFDAIEQSQEEIKHFSHDMKNHLLQIRYLEDVNEIHNYLDEVIDDVKKISYVRISSNKMLNLIISKYSAICEKKKIKFSADVKLANLQYIDDVDLSTLLNNLLDNAVEAAESTKNGFIELKIFSKNSRFDGVLVKNSCALPPKHINNELITSKKDKLLHGLGVNIVKKVLKKYDAVYDWNYDKQKQLFETSMAFPKTK